MEERVTGSAPQPFTEKANFNHSDDLISSTRKRKQNGQVNNVSQAKPISISELSLH
ncbi:hypothetical protein Bca4012_077843 [Brassica carinata]